MAKISFLWIGKTREEWIKTGINYYFKRIKHLISASLIEIKPSTSKKGNKHAKKDDLEVIRFIPSNSIPILLDERGIQFTTPQLSSFIFDKLSIPPNHICLIGGGAYGFNKAVKGKIPLHVSLSPLTFTHEMARVIIMEQVYRAITIQKGYPYHH